MQNAALVADLEVGEISGEQDEESERDVCDVGFFHSDERSFTKFLVQCLARKCQACFRWTVKWSQQSFQESEHS